MVNRPGGCGDAVPPGTVSVPKPTVVMKKEERRKEGCERGERTFILLSSKTSAQNDGNQSLALMDE